jgi:hypothetical protein
VSEARYQAPDVSLLGAEHVRRYQETDGEVGYLWNGVPIQTRPERAIPVVVLTPEGNLVGRSDRLDG